MALVKQKITIQNKHVNVKKLLYSLKIEPLNMTE